MTQKTLSAIMAKAQARCSSSGTRLTEKRQRILEVLLSSDTPMSAYELADAYNASQGESMPAMSVYRILDFLQSELLVHKLNSANKYIACSHIACAHSHDIPQFLICEKCQAVKEIAIPKRIIDELGAQVEKANYTLLAPQLELACLCSECSSSS
jgi:Fur family zinc uptake transcriptional regulator